MALNYNTICDNCGSNINISEHGAGTAGGREEERAYCPKCRHLVAERMINGFLTATIVQKNGDTA